MKHERLLYIPPDALGLTEEQAATAEALKGKVIGKKEWEHFVPEFVGTKAQTLDVKAVYREIRMAQERYQEARISQPEGKVKFETDLPVSVFFIGDVHYGSVYTDHKRFHREIEEIAETPNAYIIWMSNLIDNAIPAQYPWNMLVNAIPPDKQVITMRKIIQELDEKGKVLGAVTSPCHEGWTWKHAGQDVNALLFGFEDRRFPVLENGGRLYLQFPRAKYLIVLYHQIGPFRSNFNRLHGLQQMNRLKLKMEADIVVGAHYHVAAIEMNYKGVGEKHREPAIYIQSGTYKGISKIHDQWTIGRYGQTGEPTAQSVILWPNEKRMEPHLEFETAMLAHESHYLREVVRQEENK